MGMVIPVVDHDCALKDFVIELAGRVAKLEAENAQLKKAQYGPKSERTKMPRVPAQAVTAEQQLAKRRARAKDRTQIPTVRTEHKVPDHLRSCPKCGNAQLSPLGDGVTTTVLEFIPARFVRHEHVQEKLRCKCNGYVVTAPGAPKVVERGRYGPSFLAHLVTAKCVDHLPIYRLEKDFGRQGVPVPRSSMNDLLHRASEITRPLYVRLLDKIRVRAVVQADETRMRMQDGGNGKPKTGFVWTFVAADDNGERDVALVFAADRSGATPRRILEGTSGHLLVDAYSGYNDVATVSSRMRAACHAHVRRYFHDALATAPVAQEAIDLILALYRVEHEARDAGTVSTDSHLELRRQRAGPVRKRFRDWLDAERPKHPPKSPIGAAIRYATSQWEALGCFLEDPRVPLDNNASEAALRRVALGRKNFLFVGDVDAGTNIAGLYTLVATCEARRINPFRYLADVIARVQDHPASRIDELLPGAWAAAAA